MGLLALREQQPDDLAITSNKHFQKAVRYALDYTSIVGVAGPGAIQAPGIIPSMFLGSLPQRDAIKQNLTKAKAALAASGVGEPEVTLEYPSDLTINGVPFTTLAQKVQANLQAAGFNVELSGSPTSNWLTKYRDGKMAFGLSLWGPDYPDPGRLPRLHAGAARRPPRRLAEGLRSGDREARRQGARHDGARGARRSIYQQIQRQLNQSGPFFPLMQPTQVFVATKDLKDAVYNAVYPVDVHAGVAEVRVSSFATRAAG